MFINVWIDSPAVFYTMNGWLAPKMSKAP